MRYVRDIRDGIGQAWSARHEWYGPAATIAVCVLAISVVMSLVPARAAAPASGAPLTRDACAYAAAHSTLAADRDFGTRCVRIIDQFANATPSASPSSSASPTASPGPTGSPSPSPSPTSTGFPDASTTGVPAGTVLKTTVPPGVVAVSPVYWRVVTAGTVIDGYDVPGQLEIEVANVKVSRSRVHCAPDNCINAYPSGIGLTVSHVDIGPVTGAVGIILPRLGGSATSLVEYTHIHGVGDGLKLLGQFVIRHNLVDQLTVCSGHSDGMQADRDAITRNGLIQHNTIWGGNTSGIIVQADQGGDDSGLRIVNNSFRSTSTTCPDGSASVTTWALGLSPEVCPGGGCVATDNVFDPASSWESRSVSVVPSIWTAANWTGNTYADGSAVPVPS